jgi:prepilin-type N-terminal cleavage/methylation domain-containing protein
MAYLKKRQHGFTLQEMVIVVAIVAIISTSVYLMFINGRKLFSLQNYSAIAQDQALKASLVMQRELREARAPEGMKPIHNQ